MPLLAIESSCDETAAAIVASDGRVLADIVSTQVDKHARFGGVVPEVASREHMATITANVRAAFLQAECDWPDIEAIAVTLGPGLIGALFVGVLYAKGAALARRIPLIGVNHLEGHLAAVDLLAHDHGPTPYPHVALLVSGGHTALYRVDAPFSVRTLSVTLDDAAGEAFDKTAKQLGFGYPGGAKLSAAAVGGDASAVPFPIAMRDRVDFSFSGLKTAVATHLQKRTQPLDAPALRDLCASIEHAIVSALVSKAMMAVDAERVSTLVLGGGVAANGPLRERAAAEMQTRAGRVLIPPRAWCTDNAAMIAAAGWRRLRAGKVSGLDAAPKAYWPLGEALA
ncbi:MAG: tRNA (adenosine(37)-N6)-threonylcarbamoyltransferase complex transferase subunit TsaD [Deltaproteobacteria bacterium]|nr:tRNA (adenosine(37)-N6)-threonylcarbamoyltransferase complex transferase subunit TsaD [Deltaproteobacteria bacterium]